MDQANESIKELQLKVNLMESINSAEEGSSDELRNERRETQKTKRELEEALALIEEQEDELAKKKVKIDSLETKVTNQEGVINELRDNQKRNVIGKKDVNKDVDDDVPERRLLEKQLREKDLTLQKMEKSLEAKKIELEVANQQLITFEKERSETSSGSVDSSAGSMQDYSIADRRQSVRSSITDGHDESEGSSDESSQSSSSSSITSSDTKVSRRIYEKLKKEMVDALRLIDEQEVYLTEKEGTIVRMEMRLEKALASSTSSSSPRADSEALQRVKDDLEVAKVSYYSFSNYEVIITRILGSSAHSSVTRLSGFLGTY